MKKTFRTCDNKGFQIKFPNGIVLSTQFGWANYCENRDDPMPNFKEPRPDKFSNDAEIAIISPMGNFITAQWSKDDDQVSGYVSIEQWLSAFDWCRAWKRKP